MYTKKIKIGEEIVKTDITTDLCMSHSIPYTSDTDLTDCNFAFGEIDCVDTFCSKCIWSKSNREHLIKIVMDYFKE